MIPAHSKVPKKKPTWKHDVAKCIGVQCQIRRECYRFTAKVSIKQSWGDFWANPSFNTETGCSEFVPNKEPRAVHA